jgi:hypothetical protein
MSNVKQVAELRTMQDMDAAVAAFQAAEGWCDEVNHLWQAIRDAALAQSTLDRSIDAVAGCDSY